MENNENSNKLQIDLVVTKSETIKKEITLPHYSKTSAGEYYKVFGKGSYETIRVRWSESANYVSIDNAFNFDKAVSSEDCSQEEFDYAFNEAQKFLFDQNKLSVQNAQLIKPLIDHVNNQIEKLDKEDAEGHIWWNKFLDVLTGNSVFNKPPQSEEENQSQNQ